MAKNNLTIQSYGDPFLTIEDHRWRVTTTGMTDGQNANLVINGSLKATGPHRLEGYVKDGVPVYKGDDAKVYLYDEQAETDGKKLFGFLQSPYRIADYSGGYYEEIPVAVQTRGEINYNWLPVQISEEVIHDRFGVTKL